MTLTNSGTSGSLSTGAVFSVAAQCSGGRTLIGGGGTIVSVTSGRVYADSSFPSTPGVNGVWTFRIRADTNSSGANVTAYAICA